MTQLAAIFPSRPFATVSKKSALSFSATSTSASYAESLKSRMKRAFLTSGSSGKSSFSLSTYSGVQLQRQQVGVGEIAVSWASSLGAHGARLALYAVVQPRLLVDRPAVRDIVDLAARLGVYSLADEADRVDVLDLAAGAELSPRLVHRNVHVGAQVAFSMSPSQVPR